MNQCMHTRLAIDDFKTKSILTCPTCDLCLTGEELAQLLDDVALLRTKIASLEEENATLRFLESGGSTPHA